MSFTFVFQVPGKVIMGSTIDPLSTLPRANKIDPSVSHTIIFNTLKVTLRAYFCYLHYIVILALPSNSTSLAESRRMTILYS